MKSKEEIIQKFRDDPFTGSLTQKQAEQCFEIASEYAKQEAIAFAEWVNENWYTQYSQDELWYWQDDMNKQGLTSEHLYNLYLESKKQKV